MRANSIVLVEGEKLDVTGVDMKGLPVFTIQVEASEIIKAVEGGVKSITLDLRNAYVEKAKRPMKVSGKTRKRK